MERIPSLKPFVVPNLSRQAKLVVPQLTKNRPRTCPVNPTIKPREIVPTPRTPSLRPARKVDSEKEEDSLLSASIYLNLHGRDNKEVASKMRAICSITQTLQSSFRSSFLPVPSAKIYPAISEYDNYLRIYENNQDYFLDQDQDSSVVASNLQSLENWFFFIIEPPPVAKADIPLWIASEKKKIATGLCSACDPRAASLLLPLDEENRTLLRQRQHRYPQLA